MKNKEVFSPSAKNIDSPNNNKEKTIKRITDAKEDITLCSTCNNIDCVCKRYLIK